MFSSHSEASFVPLFKISSEKKKLKDQFKKDQANYQKYILSYGEKMTHLKNKMNAKPCIAYTSRTRWYFTENDSTISVEPTSDISRDDYNHMSSTFKLRNHNIKGWVPLECGCHWGRHPNGARRGNKKRKQKFHKPKKISIDIE